MRQAPAPLRGRASWRSKGVALACRTCVRYRGHMADLSPEEAEVLRRSIAMLPPQAPSRLSREQALAILDQLVRALRELRQRMSLGRGTSRRSG